MQPPYRAGVDTILECAKPAELPGEQRARFELVIDMKTATRLGVKIPTSPRLAAARVVA